MEAETSPIPCIIALWFFWHYYVFRLLGLPHCWLCRIMRFVAYWFVALRGFSLIGFVALWGVAYWVCRIMRFSLIGFVALRGLALFGFVALWGSGLSLIGFVALWGLSHYWACRIMTFVALCRLSHYDVCPQLWRLSLTGFVAVSPSLQLCSWFCFLSVRRVAGVYTRHTVGRGRRRCHRLVCLQPTATSQHHRSGKTVWCRLYFSWTQNTGTNMVR